MTAITWDFGFILWMAPYALIGGWFAFDDWWLALWEIGVAGILSAVAVKWHFDGILLRRLHAGFTTLLPLFWRIQARLNR